MRAATSRHAWPKVPQAEGGGRRRARCRRHPSLARTAGKPCSRLAAQPSATGSIPARQQPLSSLQGRRPFLRSNRCGAGRARAATTSGATLSTYGQFRRTGREIFSHPEVSGSGLDLLECRELPLCARRRNLTYHCERGNNQAIEAFEPSSDQGTTPGGRLDSSQRDDCAITTT